LKDKARSSLMAENPHDLMHCLQVLNLLDIGELTLVSAYDRKETRDVHVRPDYTLTDPLLSNKIHVIKQVNGKPVTDWIDLKI
jgi:succinate dehydrogenase/fumarate reductase flavoprotein subunit